MFTDPELVALRPALRRYARKLTRDAEAADDLLQSTLARALTHPDDSLFGSLEKVKTG